MTPRAGRALREQAAAALLASAGAPPLRAVVGFDGFVDSITRLVARRASMRPDDFEPIRTIAEFASRCAAAAGRSTNIERVVAEDRFGGNGPLMAGAFAALGCEVTFLGAIGADDASAAPLPIFAPFASRCREVVCLGAPGHTMALEFDDGKLMFNETAGVQRVTWDRILDRVGLPRLRAMLDGADLFGMVNWSLCAGVEDIWRGLASDVLPALASPPAIFIDLSDPAKRTDADLHAGLARLVGLALHAPVTLGLNLAEAERVSCVLGVKDRPGSSHALRLPALAQGIRARTGLHEVVIHPREGAAASWADGAGSSEGAAWAEGPFTPTPRLSTGAGDHFNAGYALARARGLHPELAAHVGAAVSGAYVRDAASPSIGRLIAMLAPPPGREGV